MAVEAGLELATVDGAVRDLDLRAGQDGQRHAGLLSIFPRQITLSWAERLAVPILSHVAAYTFLPLPLAFTLRSGPAFAAATHSSSVASSRA